MRIAFRNCRCYRRVFGGRSYSCANEGFGRPVGRRQKIKRVYKQLIDAEDRHGLAAVRVLVWNSPSTLFVAKAPVVWHGYCHRRFHPRS